MKNVFVTSAFVAAIALPCASADAQELLAKPKGNVTIIAPYYDQTAALANLETAAGGDENGSSRAPAVTIVNVPHQPAYDPLNNVWVADGPLLLKEPKPLSLRDKVRSKLTN